jgi:hypothetical protein
MRSAPTFATRSAVRMPCAAAAKRRGQFQEWSLRNQISSVSIVGTLLATSLCEVHIVEERGIVRGICLRSAVATKHGCHSGRRLARHQICNLLAVGRRPVHAASLVAKCPPFLVADWKASADTSAPSSDGLAPSSVQTSCSFLLSCCGQRLPPRSDAHSTKIVRRAGPVMTANPARSR